MSGAIGTPVFLSVSVQPNGTTTPISLADVATTADGAQTAATAAQSTASQAQTTAAAAATAAGTAQTAATQAQTAADQAQSTANSAASTAAAAESAAQNAAASASAAVATANAALTTLNPGDVFQPVGYATDVNLATPMSAMTLEPSVAFSGVPENLIVVNPGAVGHEFHGVGAALTESAASQLMKLTPAARTAFLTDVFGAKKWNHVRLCAGPSDYRTGSVYTYCDAGPIADPSLATFDLGRDREAIIPIAQEILRINPSTQFFIAPWSPPAGVKDSGSIVNGNINPTPANLTWLAQYFVKIFWAYNAYGIRFAFMQPQNEPQVNGNNYPCCGWTGAQLAEFIGTYLGPAFATAGITMPFTAVGGTNYDDEGDRRGTVLSDPVASKYATLGDTHAYAGAVSDVAQNLGLEFPHTEWIMSEYCLSKTNFPWLNIGQMCNFLIGLVRYGCGRVVMWNLMLDENGGPWQEGDSSGDNGCTTLNADGSITYNADYWLMSMFARFWQSGARICASTSNSVGSNNPFTIQTSAFINTDGSRVLFAWNPTANTVTSSVLDSVTKTGFPLTLAAGSVAVISWGGANKSQSSGTLTAAGAPSLKPPSYTTFGYPQIGISGPSATGSTAISAYNVYDASAPTVPLMSVSGQDTQFIDTTLAQGATRSYYITAVNAAGEGPQSNTVTATGAGLQSATAHYAAIPVGSANNTVSTTKILDNSSGVLSGFVLFTPSTPIVVKGISAAIKLIFGDMDGNGNANKSFGLYLGGYNQVVVGIYDKAQMFSTVNGPCVAVANIGKSGLYLGFAVNTTAAAVTDYLGNNVPANSANFYVSYDGGKTVNLIWNSAVSATSINTVASSGTEVIGVLDEGLGGNVYRAALYVGSAPTAASVNVDFTAQSSGATAFTDSAGAAWTVQSPAAIV